eukprot:scaffold2639_cov361-Pavlova_lutheri.AAC.34
MDWQQRNRSWALQPPAPGWMLPQHRAQLLKHLRTGKTLPPLSPVRKFCAPYRGIFVWWTTHLSRPGCSSLHPLPGDPVGRYPRLLLGDPGVPHAAEQKVMREEFKPARARRILQPVDFDASLVVDVHEFDRMGVLLQLHLREHLSLLPVHVC